MKIEIHLCVFRWSEVQSVWLIFFSLYAAITSSGDGVVQYCGKSISRNTRCTVVTVINIITIELFLSHAYSLARLCVCTWTLVIWLNEILNTKKKILDKKCGRKYKWKLFLKCVWVHVCGCNHYCRFVCPYFFILIVLGNIIFCCSELYYFGL